MPRYMKWWAGICWIIAVGPLAAPFLFWPASELAACERAGADTLKCVRAEWLSETASAVVHLPIAVFFTVPLAAVLWLFIKLVAPKSKP